MAYIKHDGSYFKIEVDSSTIATAIDEAQDFRKEKNPLYLHIYTKTGTTLLEENRIPEYTEEITLLMAEIIALQRFIIEHKQHQTTLQTSLTRKLSENFIKGAHYHTVSQQELTSLGDITSRLLSFRTMLDCRLSSLKNHHVDLTIEELENRCQLIRSYARYYESLRQMQKERGGKFSKYLSKSYAVF